MSLLQALINDGTISIFEGSYVWWPEHGDLFSPGSVGIILTQDQADALAETEQDGGVA